MYLEKVNDVPEKNQAPRIVTSKAYHWFRSRPNKTTDNFFTITLADAISYAKQSHGFIRFSFHIRFFFGFLRNQIQQICSFFPPHYISREDRKFKPTVIVWHNETKEYTCKRITRRWPQRLFLYVISITKNP